MSVLTRPLTYDDLLHTPDDGKRYEIIGGDLYVTPVPVPKHQQLSGRLYVACYGWVTPRKLGLIYPAPLDVLLGEHDTVEPDLVFIAQDRLHIVKDKFVQGPPDLLVEILSPSTRARDEKLKANLYARAGVREYWLVDPDQAAIQVYALADGDYRLLPNQDGRARSVVLPGFEIDITALFADLA